MGDPLEAAPQAARARCQHCADLSVLVTLKGTKGTSTKSLDLKELGVLLARGAAGRDAGGGACLRPATINKKKVPFWPLLAMGRVCFRKHPSKNPLQVATEFKLN